MFRLAVFDIDGTLRRERSPWRHLHRHLGLSEQAKEFFPKFQRGEITYEEWVALDAHLWKGVPRSDILDSLSTNPLRDGSRNLVNSFTTSPDVVAVVAISTGLSLLAAVTSAELGIHEVLCNELLFDDAERCTGEVIINVTEHNKDHILSKILDRHRVARDEVITFGDGTADIKLFKQSGTSVAICPSNDEVRAAATFIVEDEPIDSILPTLFPRT